MKAYFSMDPRILKRLAASAPALLAAACTTVGPDYRRPDVPVPAEFRFQLGATEASSFADQPWWTVFNDPALRGLIDEALANNYDLQAAVARIEQARALVGVVQSQAGPQVGYRGAASGQELSFPQAGTSDSVTFGALDALLDAAWELDLWGRIKRQTEAAEADLLAQEDVRRGVVLTLVSEVAAGYFRLVALDRELAIAEASSQSYGSTLELFTLRFEAGKDSKLPVQRTRAAYDSSAARIASLKREIAVQENALCVLLGAYPRPIRRGLPLDRQVAPSTPLGATSDLLQRRPDILEAEKVMRRANAEIGVAVANYFPRVGLSALLGGQAVVFEGGDDDAFGVWRAALDVSGPIFTSGRLREIYNERRAFWDETVARYKQTVLVAFQETSDALAAQQNLVQQRAAQQSQVEALRQSVELALLRYDGGRASYFEVLEAQQQLFPAEEELARTERDQLIAVVNLYKALGGGWSATAADSASGADLRGTPAVDGQITRPNGSD